MAQVEEIIQFKHTNWLIGQELSTFISFWAIIKHRKYGFEY